MTPPVDRSQAFRYMGLHGEPDAEMLKRADSCEKRLREAAVPRHVYRVCPITVCPEGVSCGGLVLRGQDIRRHLDGCGRAVLLCVTLSQGADRAIRAAQAEDVLAGMMTDAMASALTEQVCDAAEAEILAALPEPYATWRFSPGYGDLPLEVQGDFLRFLNAEKRLGVCVSDGGLLIPTKTVTAVVGLSEQPIAKEKRGCAVCKLSATCPYRSKGVHCK